MEGSSRKFCLFPVLLVIAIVLIFVYGLSMDMLPNTVNFVRFMPGEGDGQVLESAGRMPILDERMLPLDAEWQTVEDNITYVYSAHLDVRDDASTIVIIGTIRSDILQNENNYFYCQIWINRTLHASVRIETEFFNGLMFPSIDIRCPFNISVQNLPDEFAVSLSRGRRNMPNHLMLVRKRTIKETFRYKFIVCLWSPAFRLTDPVQLIEWLEMNILFGAEKIIFYNHTVTCPRLQAIIHYYKEQGLVDIYKWNMVEKSYFEKKSHYHLQMAMIGDCQYRHMYDSQYIVGEDLDELIVPRATHARNWADMIKATNCAPSVTFYHMRHIFFDSSPFSRNDVDCTHYNGCSSCDCVKKKICSSFLRSSCKTYRFNGTDAPGVRAKYIARPLLVRRMNIHRAISTTRPCLVPVDIGALQHYRPGRTQQLRNANFTLRDLGLARYASNISKTVGNVCAASKGIMDKIS